MYNQNYINEFAASFNDPVPINNLIYKHCIIFQGKICLLLPNCLARRPGS